ncbi:MAG: cysteine--tRNA ligase [Planctomycetes bacterium]|nr:cysteine--tRNA ligase [Planctomycetota bacterium]
MPLSLYNTLTRSLQPFTPADPAHITFYSCGPTVYDDAHIGNFRSFLIADLLRRFLESPLCTLTTSSGAPHTGPRTVTHVMNITDVGHMTDDAEGGENGQDRMAVAGQRLAEAKKSGKLPADVSIDPRDPYAIAAYYASRFQGDARTLGLKLALEAQSKPTLMPRATQHIDGMIAVIAALISRGHAYAVGPAGQQTVYFHVPSFAPYGALSNNTLDGLRAGEGGRVNAANQSEKKHPADFLLWKSDPSHIMKWPSPWGEGYPGWHIECTVMSAASLLAPGEFARRLASPDTSPALIDLHSGGEDNIFPHHECEIAQSACAFCTTPSHNTFARHWFHGRHLMVEGQKMAKSKGNFFTARDLFAKGIEPAALRLELIRTHYRSNANFTMQGLADCQRMVDRWRRWLDSATTSGPASPAALESQARFAAAMHDDLNIALALAELNGFTSSISNPTTGDAETFRGCESTLAILSLPRPAAQTTSIAAYAPGVTPSDEIESLLAQRRDARAAKDFKKSDEIRDALAARGLAIKDIAGGKVEVSRKS